MIDSTTENSATPLDFNCSPTDFGVSYLCASRAMQFHQHKKQSIIVPEHVLRDDRQVDFQELHMDILAVHLNGCELDFRKLLDSSVTDFLHDMVGMKQNLNRLTGRLENGFTPKCAKNGKASYQ